MYILGIETSCDETAVAVLEIQNGRRLTQTKSQTYTEKIRVKVLSNIISSQIKLHAKYGGVVPNLAAREHVKNIGHVFKLALKGVRYPSFKVPDPLHNIDLIAVTRGPGLGPALLVGTTFARTIAWKYDKPLIGVNHLEGHIYSNWLPIAKIKNVKIKMQNYNSKLKIRKDELFPILNLIVSGGHTELVLMQNHGKYRIIGETVDDAVGEAFDKVARLLGLGYPGGPAVSARAEKFSIFNFSRWQGHRGSSTKSGQFSKKEKIQFPRPMEHSKNYNFSYSGLKTSVLYKIRDLEKNSTPLSKEVVNQICYEFQKAATEVLIKKTVRAAKEYKVKSVFLSGGVSANKFLRTNLEKEVKNLGLNYSQPELEYTGDNATMIALAGYINWKIKSPSSPTTSLKLRSSRRLRRATNFNWKLVEMNANLGF